MIFSFIRMFAVPHANFGGIWGARPGLCPTDRSNAYNDAELAYMLANSGASRQDNA